MLVVKERENGTLRVQTKIEGESLTEQSHRDACNINTIVAKARRGIMPEIMQGNPTYGDFSAAEDFYDVQCRIAKCKSEFQMLPAAVRKRFENDPGNLIQFLSDPTNDEEARQLGFNVPKPEAASDPAPEAESGPEAEGAPPAE